MSKHVVVVGANGAIAKEVVKFYQTCGHRVTETTRTTNLHTVDILDVLILMPGKTQSGFLRGIKKEAWDSAIADNLSSVGRAMCLLAGKIKVGGNVVIVGSIVGSTGGYGCAAYAAAKAGLVGLTRAAANELASSDIKINLLELGYVDAGMGAALPDKVKESIKKTIPLGRFCETEDVVEAIDFLARTRYMTGNVLTFAGGLR